MSTTYNANGTIPAVTQPTTWAIDSSTATTPIVVSVGAALHGFATGDTVEITAHDQLAANGLWVITVVTASTFSLDGSTPSGVGTATGIVQDYAVNPLITIPSDGDAASASSVNPAFEGIFNAVPFLYQRTGAYRVYDSQAVAVAGNPLAITAWSATATIPSSLWIQCTGTASILTGYCRNGDIIEVSAVVSSDVSGGVTIADRQPLAVQFTTPVSTYQGTAALVNSDLSFVETSNLYGKFVVAGVAAGGAAFSISLAAYGARAGTTNLVDQYAIQFTQYRSNA
jgi:hypothetical protein